MSTIVELRDLSIAYRTAGTLTPAVRAVNLSIERGQTVAIVGESGSGKSTLASSIVGLLAPNAVVTGGQILVDGEDITTWSPRDAVGYAGRSIGYVPQDPLVGLNPTMRIGKQIGEAIVAATGVRTRSLDAQITGLLEQVGLDNPVLRARQYPHELSGGMRQRVLIAIALAGEPELIVADEPTSALDVTVQKKILDHLELLARERNISLLLITHDLGVAADRADAVAVVTDGQIVESGPPEQILVAPSSEYTTLLIRAAPSFTHRAAPGVTDEGAPVLLEARALTKDFRLPRVRGAGSTSVRSTM